MTYGELWRGAAWSFGITLVLLSFTFVAGPYADRIWQFLACIPFVVGVIFVYHFIAKHHFWDYAKTYIQYELNVPIHASPLKPHVPFSEFRSILEPHYPELFPLPPSRGAIPEYEGPRLADFAPMPRYRDTTAIAQLSAQADIYRATRDHGVPAFVQAVQIIVDDVPVPERPSLASVPLYEVLDVRRIVPIIISSMFTEEIVSHNVFEGLRHQLNANRYRHSAKELTQRAVSAHERIDADEFKGSNKDLVDTYLQGTPFHALFYVPFPIGLTPRSRFEHTHIIAGQGHGKTQTLQLMIDRDLETDASLIVIDPHGDMFDRIAHLESLKDRSVTIVDPREGPALNPFDVSGVNLKDVQALTGVISLYEYFFGSLLGAELTAKQGVLFRYLAHLIISIPGANLSTLIAVMDDPAQFGDAVDGLPPNARNFIRNELMPRNSAFAATRQEVKYRLYDLIENPAFDRMFNAPRNMLDLRGEMDNGGVVLVHADAAFLEQKRASVFGRFFIAKALQAALQRADQPESQRHPTYLYIDEAWMFFDTKIDQILDQARKFKLGMVLAHQRLAQATPELQSSLNTTAIKLVGRVSDADAKALAPNMHTDPSTLKGLANDRNSAEWALYDRHSGLGTVKVSIPFFHMENQPRLTDKAYAALRKTNRAKLTVSETKKAPRDKEKKQEW